MGRDRPIVMVMSPLVALREDQLKEVTKLVIIALQLWVSQEDNILNGQGLLVREPWSTGVK